MMKRVLFAVMILALMSSQVVSAQDETPEPGPGAANQLPAASAIGEGWVQNDVLSPDVIAYFSSFEMTPDVFSEGAAGTYLGPNGARVVIVNLIVTDSRVAVRASWEAATDLLNGMAFAAESDFRRQDTLDAMASPPPCVESKRVEGIESPYAVPLGATMCAQDPDNIWIFMVSGAVDGDTGVVASDAVTASVLGG